jgi:O-antigen/teichoic acid export membrane protein
MNQLHYISRKAKNLRLRVGQKESLRKVIKAVGLTGAGNLGSLFIQRVLLFPLLLRALGSSMFGSFVLVHSLVNILSYAPIASLNLAYYRNYQNAGQDDRPRLAWTVLIIAIVIGVCVSLLFYAQRETFTNLFNSQDVGFFIPGMSLFLLSMCVMWALDSQLSLRLAFRLRAGLQVSFGIVMLIVVPLAYYDPFWGPGIGMTVSSSLIGFCMLLYLMSQHSLRITKKFISQLKLLLLPGSVYFINTIAQMSFQYADRLVLGIYHSEQVVTIYFAASTVAILLFMPFALTGSVLIPFMSSGRIVINNKINLLTYYSIASILSLGTIFLGLILGPIFLNILFGADIGGAAKRAFSILLLGQGGYVLQHFTRPLLPIFFSLRLQIIIDLAAAFLLMTLLFTLAPEGGVIGAALGTSISAATVGLIYAVTGFATISRNSG